MSLPRRPTRVLAALALSVGAAPLVSGLVAGPALGASGPAVGPVATAAPSAPLVDLPAARGVASAALPAATRPVPAPALPLAPVPVAPVAPAAVAPAAVVPAAVVPAAVVPAAVVPAAVVPAAVVPAAVVPAAVVPAAVVPVAVVPAAVAPAAATPTPAGTPVASAATGPRAAATVAPGSAAPAATAAPVVSRTGEHTPGLYSTGSLVPVSQPARGGGARATLFGTSVDVHAGETAGQALSRLQGTFGALPVVRVFSPGVLPARWDDVAVLRALPARTAVAYSFKGDVAAAARGDYDARVRSFLASRPAGTQVWVAFYHEPEDDVARGSFSAAQFRAATTHLAPVIRGAGGTPTTILMEYTLSPSSHRDWHDYYSPSVDALGWDAYNTAWQGSSPSYKSARAIVDPVLAVARETGKPFGWAELGSPCISTDRSCAGRAAWLTSLGQAFSAAHASFATYWDRPDFGGGADYSLRDTPSVSAWRTFTRG